MTAHLLDCVPPVKAEDAPPLPPPTLHQQRRERIAADPNYRQEQRREAFTEERRIATEERSLATLRQRKAALTEELSSVANELFVRSHALEARRVRVEREKGRTADPAIDAMLKRLDAEIDKVRNKEGNQKAIDARLVELRRAARPEVEALRLMEYSDVLADLAAIAKKYRLSAEQDRN